MSRPLFKIKGIVRSWDAKKRTGIIIVDDGFIREKFFMHWTALRSYPTDCSNPVGYIAEFDSLELRTEQLRRATKITLTPPEHTVQEDGLGAFSGGSRE